MGTPVEFRVLKCAQCHNAITGSMFTRHNEEFTTSTICEGCYWAHHYGDHSYVKQYKHSIVEGAIELAERQGYCKCEQRNIKQGTGWYHLKFKDDNHYQISSTKSCPVFKISQGIGNAKYKGLLATGGLEPPVRRRSGLSRVASKLRRHSLSTIGQASPLAPEELTSKLYMQSSAGRAKADEDVPLFARECVVDKPFNYVHMVLRVGPILIERTSE